MSMCDDCVAKLEFVYNFKNQCEKTEASLRKILELSPAAGSPKVNENGVVLFESNYEEKPDMEPVEQIEIGPLIEYARRCCKGGGKTEEDDIVSLIDDRKRYVSETIANETKFQNVTVKNETVEYVCQSCGVIFGDMDLRNNHSLNCWRNDGIGENSPPYRCRMCSKIFKTKYAMKFHLATHEPKKGKTKNVLSICDICGKQLKSESKLAIHFYNHAKVLNMANNKAGSGISCETCAEIFSNQLDLHRHEKLTHTKSPNCEICNEVFTKEIDLINHLRRHEIYLEICGICSKKFDSPEKLRHHKKTHATKPNDIFSCPICKKQFADVDLLKNHSTTHLDESYKCEKCKRTFNNVITYDFHVKQHLEPKFLCSVCGKQYFNKVTLRCHLRTHNNEKPFKCPTCDKSFSSRATLSVHKRIHSSFKPYICSYCGYSCRQSGDLAMHVRIHTGDKPYKCTFPNCDRKFTTSSQRKEHYRRHTNERNHKCKECGKAFLESKTLKVHMLTHTGEKPHCCEICGRKFRRTHHLANHIKMHNNYVINLNEVHAQDDDDRVIIAK